PSSALCVGRRGKTVEPRFFGPVRPDALFLVASLTKPVTVAAVMLLVERGQVMLDDPVALYVPKFGQNGKRDVRLRHLMTHTSGLPDMVPNTLLLRAAHKPLAAFIDEICTLPLLFAPGTGVNYQSTGIAMLGEVVHQVTGTALPEFLRKEI